MICHVLCIAGYVNYEKGQRRKRFPREDIWRRKVLNEKVFGPLSRGGPPASIPVSSAFPLRL